MPYVTHLGAQPNLLDLYRRYPSIARYVLGLAETAVTLSERLTHGECEMLGAYISGLNACEYCHGIHKEAAVAAGIDRTVFKSCSKSPDYGGTQWQPVFAYVSVLTLNPSSINAELVKSLTDAGWSGDDIVQFAAICSAFNVLNRMVEGLGLSAEESFYGQAGKRLASIGYGGTAQMLGI